MPPPTTTTTLPPPAKSDASNAALASQLASIQTRLSELNKEWLMGIDVGDHSNRRNGDLTYASDWLRSGLMSHGAVPAWEGTKRLGNWLTGGHGGLRSEEDERTSFKNQKLPSGRTRQDIVDEYRKLNSQMDEIKAKVGAPKEASPQDVASKLAATPGSGTSTGSSSAGTPSDWTAANRLVPIITDSALQDLSRSGAMNDLTPATIANLFPHVVQDPNNPGSYKLAPDVSAFSDASRTGVRFGQTDLLTDQQLANTVHAADHLKDSQGIIDPSDQRFAGQAISQARADVLSTAPPGSGAVSLRDALQKPFSMTKPDLAALEVKLFQGGYLNVSNYDPRKALSAQFSLGDPYNPDFQKAYQAWLLDTYKDRTKSADQILNERMDANKPVFAQMAADLQKDREKRLANAVRLADPASVKQSAQQLAQSIIGHNIDDGEIANLVNFIHQRQTQYGQQVVNAQDNGGPPVTEVDVPAEIQSQLESTHRGEKAAKDYVDEMDMFLKLLGPAGGMIPGV